MSFIDPRRSIMRHLRDYGHWVAHRRAIPGRRCRCRDAGQETLNRLCRRCFGTGLLYVDEFVKTEDRVYSPDMKMGTGSFDLASGDKRFYFEHQVRMKEDDFILEIELDRAGQPVLPVNIRRAFRVKEVNAQRDRGGRVAFLEVQVDTVALR